MYFQGNEYVSLSGQTKMNYTLFPMRTPDQFSQRKVVVHEISHNIFVASTQFESPFAYSTSSWVKGNECDKDIRKFKYVQVIISFRVRGTDYSKLGSAH